MDKKTEALKLALEALRDYRRSDDDRVSVAMGILQEALAEQFCDNHCTWLDHHPDCDKAKQPAQQEPVAYVYEREIDGFGLRKDVKFLKPVEAGADLYTSPPASKPWVGLTDEQMAVLNFMLGADELDGVWFGERHPKEKGAFWWRNRLRNAFQDTAIGAKLKEKNQ